jgi:hypothetical protein
MLPLPLDSATGDDGARRRVFDRGAVADGGTGVSPVRVQSNKTKTMSGACCFLCRIALHRHALRDFRNDD